jgi:hypothetical protein
LEGQDDAPKATHQVQKIEELDVKLYSTPQAVQHMVQMTVSVPFDQHVTVRIMSRATGAVVLSLFNGMVFANDPVTVVFDSISISEFAMLKNYMPGLGETKPFYDPSQLKLCQLLRENYETIKEEYHALIADKKGRL